MRPTPCVVGTEAECDDIVSLADKALGYPKPGVNVGGGIHAVIQQTWDGTGPTPIGWVKHFSNNWVNTPSDAAVPINDAEAAQIMTGLANLTTGEQNRLINKLNNRATIPIVGRNPKANAVLVGASIAAEDKASGKANT